MLQPEVVGAVMVHGKLSAQEQVFGFNRSPWFHLENDETNKSSQDSDEYKGESRHALILPHLLLAESS